MRISISKSKNHEFLYIIRDLYNNGSRTTKRFKTLGKVDDLCREKNMSRDELIAWARNYAKELTLKEKNENIDTIIPFHPDKIIQRDTERKFNCGYLFLQDIYYSLRIDNICRNIKGRYKFKYDLDAILSDLIYSRILFPGSKCSAFEDAFSLLEKPKYELHDVYRSLSVLAKENNYIQSELYKNSHFLKKRNTSTLYYDCTNYYFEIEEDDDFRKYGKSKENRPNPIVGMGLMMDGDGIPLAFDMYEGNKNEQTTLKPLEERIIKDFEFSKFIYCSDAGLASKTNKKFNSIQDRAYIITQSLRKLKKTRKNPNDPARFIEKVTTNQNGEVIEEYYSLDQEKINEEARYDGFYAITTNLEDDDVKAIISVSEGRWQIEECFRIMKTDFKARPVYVSLREHIEAHFLTCFISLIVYRLLAEKLNNKYTVTEILETLRDMEMVDTQYSGYVPAYKRTQLTDDLHKIFGFRTDYEIISKKKMRNIIKNTKTE